MKIEAENYFNYRRGAINPGNVMGTSPPVSIPKFSYAGYSGFIPPNTSSSNTDFLHKPYLPVPIERTKVWTEKCRLEGPVTIDGKNQWIKITGERLVIDHEGTSKFVRWTRAPEIEIKTLPFQKITTTDPTVPRQGIGPEGVSFGRVAGNALFAIGYLYEFSHAMGQNPQANYFEVLSIATNNFTINTIGYSPLLLFGPLAIPISGIAMLPDMKPRADEAMRQCLTHKINGPEDFIEHRDLAGKALDLGVLHVAQVLNHKCFIEPCQPLVNGVRKGLTEACALVEKLPSLAAHWGLGIAPQAFKAPTNPAANVIEESAALEFTASSHLSDPDGPIYPYNTSIPKKPSSTSTNQASAKVLNTPSRTLFTAPDDYSSHTTDDIPPLQLSKLQLLPPDRSSANKSIPALDAPSSFVKLQEHGQPQEAPRLSQPDSFAGLHSQPLEAPGPLQPSSLAELHGQPSCLFTPSSEASLTALYTSNHQASNNFMAERANSINLNFNLQAPQFVANNFVISNVWQSPDNNPPAMRFDNLFVGDLTQVPWSALGPKIHGQVQFTPPQFYDESTATPTNSIFTFTYDDAIKIHSEDLSANNASLHRSENETPINMRRSSNNKLFTYSPPKTGGIKTPAWVQGVEITGSLGAGWVAKVTLQLSYGAFGIGVGVLVATEVISYFIRRHEKHKLEREKRNNERARAQCGIVENDLNKANEKIDIMLNAANAYLSESDPIRRQQRRHDLERSIQDADTINTSNNNTNNHRVGHNHATMPSGSKHNHQLRDETRKFCKKVRDGGYYQRNANSINSCKDYLAIDDAAVETLISRLPHETDANKKHHITQRVLTWLSNDNNSKALPALLTIIMAAKAQAPSDAHLGNVHFACLINAGNHCYNTGNYKESREFFKQASLINSGDFHAQCGNLLSEISLGDVSIETIIVNAKNLQTKLNNGKDISVMTPEQLKNYFNDKTLFESLTYQINQATKKQYKALITKEGTNDEIAEAARTAENLIQNNPYMTDMDKAQCATEKGINALSTDHFEDAITSFTSVLAVSPHDFGARCGLILAETRAGKSLSGLFPKVKELQSEVNILSIQLTTLKTKLSGLTDPTEIQNTQNEIDALQKIHTSYNSNLDNVLQTVNTATTQQYNNFVQKTDFSSAEQLYLASVLPDTTKNKLHEHWDASKSNHETQQAINVAFEKGIKELSSEHFADAMTSFTTILALNPHDFGAQCGLILAEIRAEKPLSELFPKVKKLESEINVLAIQLSTLETKLSGLTEPTEIQNTQNEVAELQKILATYNSNLDKVLLSVNSTTFRQYYDLVQKGDFSSAKNLYLDSVLPDATKNKLQEHCEENKFNYDIQQEINEASGEFNSKHYPKALVLFDAVLVKNKDNFTARCRRLMTKMCMMTKPQQELPEIFADIKKLQTKLVDMEKDGIKDAAQYSALQGDLENLVETANSVALNVCASLVAGTRFDEAFDIIANSCLSDDEKAGENQYIAKQKQNYIISNSLAIAVHTVNLMENLYQLYCLIRLPRRMVYAPIIDPMPRAPVPTLFWRHYDVGATYFLPPVDKKSITQLPPVLQADEKLQKNLQVVKLPSALQLHEQCQPAKQIIIQLPNTLYTQEKSKKVAALIHLPGTVKSDNKSRGISKIASLPGELQANKEIHTKVQIFKF